MFLNFTKYVQKFHSDWLGEMKFSGNIMQERLFSGKKKVTEFHWALKFFAAKKLKEKESIVFW